MVYLEWLEILGNFLCLDSIPKYIELKELCRALSV